VALFPVRHVGLKVLSIAVAVLLWLVVAGDPVVERTLRVGLELQRLPEGLELVGNVPDAVSVRLRGPASQLSGLGPADVAVVVDLDGARPGRRLFTLTSSDVTVPYGLEVMQIGPPTLALSFEPGAWRIVPIRPRLEGIPVPGHSVTNVSVTPSQVRVAGPESAIAGVNEVLTEPVTIEHATSLVREAVTLEVPDSGVRLDSNAGTAVVTVTISTDTIERTVVGVPIAIRGGPPGARAEPDTASVLVQGAPSVVRALTPGDISLFVDVSRGPASGELPVRAEASPQVIVRSIEPPAVRVGAAGRP
jgi:YbbR domain-containing protein